MAADTLQPLHFAIPNGSGTPEWQRHPGEIWVTEAPDGLAGVIQVNDPLLGPYRFGDRSLITDPVADTVMVEVWNHFSYLMDSRQLGWTEQTELLPGHGRLSRMGHMLSAAAIMAKFGGTPQEILTMGLHDIQHRAQGHRQDELIEAAGEHTAHDADISAFMVRSGFADHLVARGLCSRTEDHKRYVLHNGVALDTLVVDKAPHSVLNYSSGSRFLDADRLSYALMQLLVSPGGVVAARAQLAEVCRMEAGDFGDQFVFMRQEAAAAFTREHLGRLMQSWAAMPNLLLGQLANMLTRHVLTSQHQAAERYLRHFPGDALRGLETDWQATLETIARTDPGVNGLMKVIGRVVRHGRESVHTPEMLRPSWLMIFSQEQDVPFRDTTPSYAFGDDERARLTVYTNAGKRRVIDPVVKVGESFKRLSDIDPTLSTDVAGALELVGRGFAAVIHLRTLGLDGPECAAIQKMTSRAARDNWRRALQRPQMSPDQLREHIGDLRDRYREIGRLPVSMIVEKDA